MADCVFCSIARGEVPVAIVFEDDVALAFLDHRPVFPGHMLLITRAHVPTLPDLPAADVGPYFADAQMLSRAVPDALGADGTFVAVNNVVSQSVPHLHVHVVPRRRKDGLRGFFWPRTRYASDAQMNETADLIRARVADLRERPTLNP